MYGARWVGWSGGAWLVCVALACSQGSSAASVAVPDAVEAGSPDAADSGKSGAGGARDAALPHDGGAPLMPDAAADAATDGSQPVLDASTAEDAALPPGNDGVIRGRFESAGPIRNCDQVVSSIAPDGILLRPAFDTCGDDMAGLARTIVANLDAAHARGQRALVVIGQGVNLPAAWLNSCEKFALSSGSFVGELCLPWDASYQASLRSALSEHIAPAVFGHPALVGVYFTISTMTNGSEMHFRVDKAAFPYPGDTVFRQAYKDVMELYQEAFEVPIVFEAGHCLWLGQGDAVDCETPRELYRHTRDTHGKHNVGLALWNCAERFWATVDGPEAGTRPLLEEAVADGVSLGCQTVGSFSSGACRFSSDAVADYGTPGTVGSRDNCPQSATFDPIAACVDTMNWFAGSAKRAVDGLAMRGTWAEIWSVDYESDGVYETSPDCRAAVDQLAL